MSKLNYLEQEPPIFLINASKIEGRFDPYFYNSDLQKFTSITNHSVNRINDIALNFKSGFGVGRQDQATETEGLIQIRPTNISNEGTLKFDKNVYIPYDCVGNNDLAEKGDVLFNNTNSQDLVGKTVFYDLDERLAFSNHITQIKVDKSQIIPEYLWIILNIYQLHKIFFSVCTNWNNQSGVGIELLKSMKIPVPEIDFQQKIVDTFNFALKSKQQKESQANELLKSIDEYLLSELGIILPTKDNSIQNRIFTTTFGQVSGNRFDPKQYETFAQNLFAAIENSKYDKIRLKKLITQSVAGDWGLDETAPIDENEYTKCLVIRATEFDNDFNLNISNSRAKFRLIKNDKLQKLDIKFNDLLIEKSGGSPDQPVGRISILTKELVNENTLCYSNFIHKIRVDTTEILPEYLFCFLKTIHNIKVTEIMQSQTNGIRNLIMREYFNQKIVIPDKTKQKEISDKANKMRDKAKQLREEAINELNKARETIEKMILE